MRSLLPHGTCFIEDARQEEEEDDWLLSSFRSCSGWNRSLSILCSQCLCNLVFWQIFLFLSYSIFSCLAGSQDVPSTSNIRPAVWPGEPQFDPVISQTGKCIDIGILQSQQTMWGNLPVSNIVGSAGFPGPYCVDDSLVQLFQLVCLPGSCVQSLEREGLFDDTARDSGFSGSTASVRRSPACASITAPGNGVEGCDKEVVEPLPLPSSQGEAYINNEQEIAMGVLAPVDSQVSQRPVEIPDSVNLDNIVVRQEHGGGPYNYASQSKGAKILSSNKEAKGASNILTSDKDKYMHTPCSAQNKFVDVELVEETLVITISIANHEFYSSNVRNFELLGSLVYPTDEWTMLGRFEAENVRVTQAFKVDKPKWVRYLRFHIVSHYGSDFYCTLSVLEVYGVDAIEWLLEDWFAEASAKGPSPRSSSHKERDGKAGRYIPPLKQTLGEKVVRDTHAILAKTHLVMDSPAENSKKLPSEANGRPENLVSDEPHKADKVHHQGSRPAPDAVMKLLMQKVRSLEQGQPSLSQQMQRLSNEVELALAGHESEFAQIASKLDAGVAEVRELRSQIHSMESQWMQEKSVLQKELSDQAKIWNEDMEMLRNHVRNLENKELLAMVVALVSVLIIAAVHVMSLCRQLLFGHSQNTTKQSVRSPLCTEVQRLIALLLSLALVVFILLL